MQIKIHRGIDQIGGCITEIATSTTHILIDLGLNLPDNEGKTNDNLATTEAIKNLTDGIDTIFYTHYHGDHVGLMEYVPKKIPQYIGKVAKEIIQIKAKYLPSQSPEDYETLIPYNVMQKIEIGDITITPFLVSHSAADAYMLLIEAEGKKVLHTGDFRDHGYLGKGLEQFVPKYIGQVDVLIIEGTMLGRANEKVKHEVDLKYELKDILNNHKYNFVICSSTDMDRLATIYSATPKGRLFVCDRYQKDILDVFTANNGSYSELFRFEELTVFPKNGLLDEMNAKGFTMLVRPNQYKTGKYWRFTDLVTNTVSKIQRAVIYSLWGGYLDRESTRNPYHIEYLESFGENIERLHTSGHATRKCLVSLCEMTSPRLAIIPIHSEQSADYLNLPLPEDLKSKVTITTTTFKGLEIVV